MSKAASVSKLEALHAKLAEVLEEVIDWHRNEKLPISAADANVIRTFLKDNEITAAPDDLTLEGLKEKFQDGMSKTAQERAQRIVNGAEDSELAKLL